MHLYVAAVRILEIYRILVQIWFTTNKTGSDSGKVDLIYRFSQKNLIIREEDGLMPASLQKRNFLSSCRKLLRTRCQNIPRLICFARFPYFVSNILTLIFFLLQVKNHVMIMGTCNTLKP